jgi:hypothetical protein
MYGIASAIDRKCEERKMTKTELKTLENVRDSLNELLQNLYDADEHLHPETGEPLPDISEAEKSLSRLNRLIEANNE